MGGFWTTRPTRHVNLFYEFRSADGQKTFCNKRHFCNREREKNRYYPIEYPHPDCASRSDQKSRFADIFGKDRRTDSPKCILSSVSRFDYGRWGPFQTAILGDSSAKR